MLKIGSQLVFKTVKNLAKPLALKPNLLINGQPKRNTSFFNRRKYNFTQEQLWKGVTSVSNAGKRRGRGKGGDMKTRRNLNFGQRLGEGKIKVLWPGLNYTVLGQHGISEVTPLPSSKEEQPAVTPTEVKAVRNRKVHPLERGWTGKTVRGMFIGPPDPVQDETFEGFDSVVLDHILRTKMTATLGRKRTFVSTVATGNRNGLIGIGKGSAIDSKAAIKLAKKRASRRLLTIDLIQKNKINHDFFSEYGRTKVTVLKKPEGYGLKCHRIIAALCKLIGIENIYAKTEGARNVQHIIRAFIVGLLRQKTYQQIADEKKLHLVEFTEESHNFPNVLASPKQCLTPAEARKNPEPFEQYIMGGKLYYDRGQKLPFYTKLPGWKTHLKRTLYHRNHEKVRIELRAKYGDVQSHLTEIYPECTGHL